jgi:hypothetical protein
MRIYGIDFTSAPSKKKPITCLECTLHGAVLHAGPLISLPDFRAFEELLAGAGPWIAGIDFPFGQSRRFIENIGWPQDWRSYVEHAASLGRQGFCDALTEYRRDRPYGDKEHLRLVDRIAGSISPQKLFGVPVGKMFYEGARRLLASGVHIPGLHHGDQNRIVVEAYPGILVRTLFGKASYKQDDKTKQTLEQLAARESILGGLVNGKARDVYGVTVSAPSSLAKDPTGDELDALLCAVQAAWAWTHREQAFGMPEGTDQLEGWIADPSVRR